MNLSVNLVADAEPVAAAQALPIAQTLLATGSASATRFTDRFMYILINLTTERVDCSTGV